MRRRKKKGSFEKYKSFIELDLSRNENIRENVSKFIYDDNGKKYPLLLELGAGRCAFSIELAKRNFDKKVIAVEFKEELLNIACNDVDNEQLTNIKFIHGFIEKIEDWFDENSVDSLYLNFSDPWPKARHFKRRLTYREFLKKYSKILKKNGIIEIKTDQKSLYDFTLEELEYLGMQIEYKTENLEHSSENILTDYEKKFREKGNNIFKIIVINNK